MAADFPTSIATLATISPTDEMDDPGLEGDVVINRITEELVAVQTQIGVTGSSVSGTVEKRLTDTIAVANTALSQSGVNSVSGRTGVITLDLSDVSITKAITASGITGNRTLNTTCGSVNFGASASSLVVTNNLVTTSSVIVATVATNDTTMKSVQAVAVSGSFTLHANAAATAETRVNWLILN